MAARHVVLSGPVKGVGHWTDDRIESYHFDLSEKVLDVACGNRKIPGSFGIDSDSSSQADLVFDLEKKWPMKAESYDTVFCLNFLEHTFHFNHILEEIHRVLRPKGILHVEVPYYNSYNFGQVPFHHIHFAENTMRDFFTRKGMFSRYSNAKFKIIEEEFFFTRPAKIIPKRFRLPLSHYIGNLCYQIYWKLERD